MSTIEQIRRHNLGILVAEAGGPTLAAQKLGTSQSQLSQWLHGLPDSKTGKARGISAGSCRRIETAFNRPEGWMDQQHSLAGEPSALYLVAHDLSHSRPDTALPLVEWEALMDPVEAEVFRTVLPDDALAPDYPRGTEIVWSKKRRVTPGRPVLLRDAFGRPHARLCQEGRQPGHWRAIATQRGYLDFDTTTDTLTVLAAYKGVLEPDDA